MDRQFRQKASGICHFGWYLLKFCQTRWRTCFHAKICPANPAWDLGHGDPGCGEALDRYETQGYQLKLDSRKGDSEDYRNVLVAEYSSRVLRSLLYGSGIALNEPGRKNFLDSQDSLGTVTIRILVSISFESGSIWTPLRGSLFGPIS